MAVKSLNDTVDNYNIKIAFINLIDFMRSKGFQADIRMPLFYDALPVFFNNDSIRRAWSTLGQGIFNSSV